MKKLYHNPHIWHYIAFGLSIFGLLVATYLWYEYQQPTDIGCALQGCQTVRESIYAKFMGIDVPIFGIVYYLLNSIYITSLLIERRRFRYEILLFVAFNFTGALVSVYLTYLEVYVIEAICQYCVMSAVAAILLFIVSANFITTYNKNDLSYAEA